ncbi:IS1595 family transposase [Deinococcota bacterium DY0809b]
MLEHFVAGTTARSVAEHVSVNRNTVNRFYFALRQIIAEEMEKATPLHGEVEVDESYFGGGRKGKRGRGAAGKVPVFGLLKRGGRVYTLPIPDAKAKTLMPILEARVVPDSVVYTDSFAGYDVMDVSRFHHVRINHGKAFAEGEANKRHTGGIENFWNQARRPLRRYNGIPRKHFYYFLKECEWRSGGGNHKALYRQLLGWARREGLLK